MSEESIFNPQQLLDDTTTEAGSRRPPLPLGQEFLAVIGEPRIRVNQGKKDPTKTYTSLDLPMKIDVHSNPNVPSDYPTDLVQLTHQVMLDLTDHGRLDWSPGKNSRLTRVREATGTNVAGQGFNPRQLEGRQVRVRIDHEEYPEGSGEMQDRIGTVIKPS